jgi:hypothetical protein
MDFSPTLFCIGQDNKTGDFMKRTVFLALALFALMAVGVYAQTEADFTVSKSADGKSITITKYKGKETTVNIPAKIQNLPVTVIGFNAFILNKNITSVNIPNGVTIIEQNAFGNCSKLASVTIPNSVTSIGDGVFSGTSITSVTIPNSVTSIGESVFGNCTKLSTINLEAGNSVYLLQDGVLYNKAKTTLIQYPPGKTNASFTIPNTVTSIGSGAFFGCTSLKSVTIPNSVTSVGNAAFADCTGITSINIPNSVTSIGNAAFSKTGITSVTIPNNLNRIADFAFSNNGITSVTIPNSVTRIGDGAFDSTALTNITIPNSVTRIGDNAFGSCTKLNSVTFTTGSNITDASFGSEAFPEGKEGDGGNTLKTAYKTGKAGTYTRAANGSTWIKGEQAAAVPAYNGTPGLAFTAINKNKEYSVTKGTVTSGAVVIPASYNNLPVTAIDFEAFRGTQITAVTIPDSVDTIGGNAFQDCRSLTSVTIPNSVTNLDVCVFYGCRSLTSVTIPKNVTNIDPYAFQGCTGLTSVTFAGSIPKDNFDDDAFRGVGDIRAKYLAGGAGTYTKSGTTWTKQGASTAAPAAATPAIATPAAAGTPGLAFTAINNNKEYSVAKGTVTSGAVVIPATYNNLPVTTIADNAFNETQITTVIMPQGITRINSYAFRRCASLTSISIPMSVGQISTQAFNGCTSLTSVTFFGPIPSTGFHADAFPGLGDIRDKYLARGPGTYTRPSGGTTWTRQ